MGRPSKTKGGEEGEERKRVRLDSGGDNSSVSNASSPPLTAGVNVHTQPLAASVCASSGFSSDQPTHGPLTDVGSFGNVSYGEVNNDTMHGIMGGYQANVSPSTSGAARSVSTSSAFGYDSGVNMFGALPNAAVLGLAHHSITEASPAAIYNLDNSSVSMAWTRTSREQQVSQSSVHTSAASHSNTGQSYYTGHSSKESVTPTHAVNGKDFGPSTSDFALCSPHSLHLLECSPLSASQNGGPGDNLAMNEAFSDMALPHQYSSVIQQAASSWNVSLDEVLCTLKQEVDDDDCDNGLLPEPLDVHPSTSASTPSGVSMSVASIPLTTSLATAVTNHVISSMTLSNYGASTSSSDVVSQTLGSNLTSAKEQHLDMNYQADYWTNASLPHEDILLSDAHVQIVYDIQAAYNRFVETSSNINKQLRREFEACIVVLL